MSRPAVVTDAVRCEAWLFLRKPWAEKANAGVSFHMFKRMRGNLLSGFAAGRSASHKIGANGPSAGCPNFLVTAPGLRGLEAPRVEALKAG